MSRQIAPAARRHVTSVCEDRYGRSATRDGKADVVVGYVEAPGSVFFNQGAGQRFREVRWNDGKGAVYGVAVGDVDGVGWPDIVAARSDAPNGVWFNTRSPARGSQRMK